MALNLKPIELVSLVLMLIPGIALIGAVIYIVACGLPNGTKLIIFILAALIGTIPAIFLWLDALGIINL